MLGFNLGYWLVAWRYGHLELALKEAINIYFLEHEKICLVISLYLELERLISCFFLPWCSTYVTCWYLMILFVIWWWLVILLAICLFLIYVFNVSVLLCVCVCGKSSADFDGWLNLLFSERLTCEMQTIWYCFRGCLFLRVLD